MPVSQHIYNKCQEYELIDPTRPGKRLITRNEMIPLLATKWDTIRVLHHQTVGTHNWNKQTNRVFSFPEMESVLAAGHVCMISVMGDPTAG